MPKDLEAAQATRAGPLSRLRVGRLLEPDTDRTGLIAELIDSQQAVEWARADRRANLKKLFAAINRWALEQVRYYDGRRARRMLGSGMLRFLALLFGTAGIVAPLIDLTTAATTSSGNLGYALLAIAAAFVAANAVFGSTAGHIRPRTRRSPSSGSVIESQAKLAMYEASVDDADAMSDEALAEGFAIIRDYAAAIHDIVLAESREWAS